MIFILQKSCFVTNKNALFYSINRKCFLWFLAFLLFSSFLGFCSCLFYGLFFLHSYVSVSFKYNKKSALTIPRTSTSSRLCIFVSILLLFYLNKVFFPQEVFLLLLYLCRFIRSAITWITSVATDMYLYVYIIISKTIL